MSLLYWESRYSVGIAAVDHEHRELIELINRLYDKATSGGSKDAVLDFFGNLFKAISAHFALEERFMEKIITVGLDLAKSIFQVHGIAENGKVLVRRTLRRSQVLPFFRSLPSCLVGMEACASAHYWAREIAALGHYVRMMPPAYVKPYVKRNKTDVADAEAICEAVTRPTMRFVPVKTAEQQAASMPE